MEAALSQTAESYIVGEVYTAVHKAKDRARRFGGDPRSSTVVFTVSLSSMGTPLSTNELNEAIFWPRPSESFVSAVVSEAVTRIIDERAVVSFHSFEFEDRYASLSFAIQC
jgi:hypothetical protein